MVNNDKVKELDNHWSEVTKLAEKYGYILQAYGGLAVIATHKTQLEELGEEEYISRQKEMFRNDMEV